MSGNAQDDRRSTHTELGDVLRAAAPEVTEAGVTRSEPASAPGGEEPAPPPAPQYVHGAGRPLEMRAIEAVLMVAEEPVPAHLLAELLEIPVERVETLCAKLRSTYVDENRGFVLVKIAGGYRFQSHPDMAAFVERFALSGQSARMTNAALETLAIVAYKQPISRAQVSQIRGVNVESTVAMLVSRGYVEEVARDPGVGHAVLYGTTPLFLEKLGLGDLSELPPLADFVPGPDAVERLEAGLRPAGD